MHTFSKSKLLSLRQCPKRLWLEVNRPQLRENSDAIENRFKVGHEVGEIAREIYDPAGVGELIDINREGFARALQRSTELLDGMVPVFEAGFSAGGAMAFADALLPAQRIAEMDPPAWHMVEVKSSTKVKDYHRDDVAIQAFVARAAGVNLASVSLAHIDSSWTYPGQGNYQGLLKLNDLTEEADGRRAEVQAWIAQAQRVCESEVEPDHPIGAHCDEPFACGFYAHCSRNEPAAEHPIAWLPNFGAKAQQLAKQGVIELKDVPDGILNARQQRVKITRWMGQFSLMQSGPRQTCPGMVCLHFSLILRPSSLLCQSGGEHVLISKTAFSSAFINSMKKAGLTTCSSWTSQATTPPRDLPTR